MDRYYRAHCPHGVWVALLTEDAAQRDTFLVGCPAGCVVELTSTEDAPPEADLT